MNWISIAWAMAASETIEEILIHLWKGLVGQLHGPLAFRTDPSTQRGRNLRDPRWIKRRAGRSARLFLGGPNGSEPSKRPIARRLEGCGQDFRPRRGPRCDLPAHRFSLALSWRSASGRERLGHSSVSGSSRPGQPHREL
jgi:hypothetical protein